MIKKAIIPAAGFGTRFLPATKTIPKELFPIVDTPTLQFIVEEAILAGINDILIIISEYKTIIADYFKRNESLEAFLKSKNKDEDLIKITEICKNANIKFIYQTEVLGLGHAILQAKEFVGNEAFAVLLGDDLFRGKKPAIKELIEVFNQYQYTVIGTMKVSHELTNKYGICEIDKELSSKLFKLKGIIEKPLPKDAPSLYAASGRYILTPSIFSILETQVKGIGGEIQLTDAILRLIDEEDV